jgi:hypothetical protein
MKNYTIVWSKDKIPAFFWLDNKIEPITPTGFVNWINENPIEWKKINENIM